MGDAFQQWQQRRESQTTFFFSCNICFHFTVFAIVVPSVVMSVRCNVEQTIINLFVQYLVFYKVKIYILTNLSVALIAACFGPTRSPSA